MTSYLRRAIWGADVPAAVPEDPYSPSASQIAARARAAAESAKDASDADVFADDGASDIPDGPLVLPGDVAGRSSAGTTVLAPRPDDIADVSYTPATSAVGLEEVGTLPGRWFDSASEEQDHWAPTSEEDASAVTEWFGARGERAMRQAAQTGDRWGRIRPEVVRVQVRRAVVEALAVRQQLRGEERSAVLAGRWRVGGRAEMEMAMKAVVEVGQDGEGLVARDDAGTVEGIVSGLRAASDGEEAEEVLMQDGDEAKWDDGWERISLSDPWLKFAVSRVVRVQRRAELTATATQVTKRITQLTGKRIPDSWLIGVETVEGLLAVVAKPLRESKLAQVLEEQGILQNLPNVTVYPTRVTPIDKEKMVGRWKVIEKELAKRGLPVVGHEHLPKFKEKDWVWNKA